MRNVQAKIRQSVLVPIDDRDEDGPVRIARPDQSAPANARQAVALLGRIAAQLWAELDKATPDDESSWRVAEAHRYLSAGRAIERDRCVSLPSALRAVIGFAGVSESILEGPTGRGSLTANDSPQR
jgi:hypothetical protein